MCTKTFGLSAARIDSSGNGMVQATGRAPILDTNRAGVANADVVEANGDVLLTSQAIIEVRSTDHGRQAHRRND